MDSRRLGGEGGALLQALAPYIGAKKSRNRRLKKSVDDTQGVGVMVKEMPPEGVAVSVAVAEPVVVER